MNEQRRTPTQASLTKSRPRRTHLRKLAVVALCLTACAGTVIGCGWFGAGSEHSVRFSGLAAREFERLPPLAEYEDVDAPRSDDWDEEYGLRYEAEERHAKAADALWQSAQDEETRGELAQARITLRRYLSDPYATDQAKRNTALDQLDALTALDEGAPADAVQAYLNARHTYDGQQQQNVIDDIQHALDVVPHEFALQDNVAYLRAAVLYGVGEFDEAAQAFSTLVARYPHSEKRAAALYMAGVSHLKNSRSFKDENGETYATGTSSPPCPDCRDADWRAAREQFTRLLVTEPHCAYAADARGWLAFLHLRTGDIGGGLAEYYRMLADTTNRQARVEAIRSLRLARAHATDADMARVEALLADEPPAALAYAYHNIYNYPYSYYLSVPETDEENSSAEDEEQNHNYSADTEKRLSEMRDKSQQDAAHNELQRAANFATRLFARYPATHIGGAFSVRLAEAQLELADTHAAHTFAVRALALGVAGDLRHEALWIKGVAEYRAREYDAARHTLQMLVAEQPHGRLTEGARRLIAMTCEDAGDHEGALEQYLALNYQTDIAYFIDVLLTPEQLAAYLDRPPQTARQDELYYALGVRYLRAGRFDEARAAYAHVHTKSEGNYYSYDSNRNCDLITNPNRRAGCLNPKDMDAWSDAKPDGIPALWVRRDLQTANEIEALQRQIEMAVSDEAKAEALYQLASFYYESSLLFYNPIWSGVRHYELVTLDEQNGYRRPGEAQLVFQHMQEHDAAARALPVYLEVVNRFPDTRAARDALYTAAVCHERLANYNNYWRNLYAAGLHAGARMVTYADVRAAYPAYQLPRATYGWEPSTRTVNGGPGWDAPPKPKLRLKGLALFRHRALKLWHILSAGYARSWQQAVELWEGHLRRWYMIVVLIGGLLSVRRLAARARVQLRTQLARHSLPPDEGAGQEFAPPRAFCGWRVRGWGEQAWTYTRAQARTLWRRVRPLMRDATGRAALAESTLTHALLATILVALLWTIHAS